ncbi:MAG: 30S ribosome-binding factor RbfA [Chloroflexota bacterium]
MVSKLRAERIGERIREELSLLLLQEVSDPRLGGVTVTGVDVDRELAYAEVYVSVIEGSERWPEIKEGLVHANSFLRRELAQRIELRVFPRLRFHWDATFEKAERIEQLFTQMHEEDRLRQQSAGDQPAGEQAGEAQNDVDEDEEAGGAA